MSAAETSPQIFPIRKVPISYSITIEAKRISPKENHTFEPNAPLTTKVVYDFFKAEAAFPDYVREMTTAVKKTGSGQFTREEILRPRNWILLHFLFDLRTGLGRFRNFAKSDRTLMLSLTDYCRRHPIERVMKHFNVTERSDRYFVLEENPRSKFNPVHSSTKRRLLSTFENRISFWPETASCPMSCSLRAIFQSTPFGAGIERTPYSPPPTRREKNSPQTKPKAIHHGIKFFSSSILLLSL